MIPVLLVAGGLSRYLHAFFVRRALMKRAWDKEAARLSRVWENGAA